MIRTLTLWVAVLLLAGIAVAQGPAAKTKAKPASKGAAADQTIMNEEKQLWEAWKNHDPAPFKVALKDNMVFVDGTGVSGKTQFLDDLAKKPCEVKNVSLSDMKVTMVDGNTAAVTYKAVLDGTCNGEPAESSYGSTVYKKEAGKWMVALHQNSAIPKK